MNTARLGVLVLILVTACTAPAPTFAPPETRTQTPAALELLREGCPDGGPVCAEEPEIENGLACWDVDGATWCTPVDD